MIEGDVDYGVHGEGYATQRRTDPRIARYITEALGGAKTVLNVGAGAGSYEPADRSVVAVEPSAAMRRQRHAAAVPAIDASAEHLPFDDASFDAAMATVTVHQWSDIDQGLRELRRVARGPVIVLTFDGDALDRFWLRDYVPELTSVERARLPAIDRIVAGLGGSGRITEVIAIPIPIDCVDGFADAFYARPEAFLDEAVRRSQSAWTFLPAGIEQRFVETLADDLRSGTWDREYGEWRTRPSFEGALRLIVSRPA